MFFFFNDDDNKIGVPGFEQTIKPILLALKELGGKASVSELDEVVIRIMNLSPEVLEIMHKGSRNRKEIEYRMAWGRTYLKKYGLITNRARGIWELTDKFDGDIGKIDVDEIVQKVRSGSESDGDAKLRLTGFESALAFENMVKGLLHETAGKEERCVPKDELAAGNFAYDVLLPNGLENNAEEMKCVIQYIGESKQMIQEFFDKVKERLANFFEEDKILVITNIFIPEEDKGIFGDRVLIWDREDLLDRIEPEASYAQYLINPQQALIKDVVVNGESEEKRHIKRNQYIRQIKDAFHKQDMVLFLGAGVSIDGGVPLWESLIKTLHISMLSGLTKDDKLSFKQQEMIRELAEYNGMESPLIQMRYIRAAFSNNEYYKLVHSALYGQAINIDTKLLNAIAKISTPQRAYCGIKSIITYNFDDLLERKLAQRDIQYHVISDEMDRQMVDKLNIYHVHGYLPSDFSQTGDKPNLIFSEEDYHRVYQDSYSWSNLAQLSALRENTCLFIGCSLTDPNLRRLLDVAARIDEKPRHYAFLKKRKLERKQNGESVNKEILNVYRRIDDNIQTAYYKNLGLNIIWIDEYEEIPYILNGFLQ